MTDDKPAPTKTEIYMMKRSNLYKKYTRIFRGGSN